MASAMIQLRARSLAQGPVMKSTRIAVNNIFMNSFSPLTRTGRLFPISLSSQRCAIHNTSPFHRAPVAPIRIILPESKPPAKPPKSGPQKPGATQQQSKSSPQQQHSPRPPTTPPSSPPPGGQSSRDQQQQKERKFRFPSAKSIAYVCVLLLVYTFIPTPDIYHFDKSKTQRSLNPDTFTPFRISSIEPVSSTAFILTLSPLGGRGQKKTLMELEKAWEHGGLWSVEVKQPEIMVSRDYTPLPPSRRVGGEEGEEEKTVRLYVRKLGLVSKWLSGLEVGGNVELRGPRLGFDLRKRIGEVDNAVAEGKEKAGLDNNNAADQPQDQRVKRVVFLAGGTGIATALQAAEALLAVPGVEMDIVWANRRREDCVGCGSGQESGDQNRNAVLAMLEEFRRAYGAERFRYSCTVDEEGSFITRDTIARLMAGSTTATTLSSAATGSEKRRSSSSIFGFLSSSQPSPTTATTTTDTTKTSPTTQPIDSSNCHYHSPILLAASPDSDPSRTNPTPEAVSCKCVSPATGQPVNGGKNLLILSGPEGFIEHYAGAKIWSEGRERQGVVGGVVGDVINRELKKEAEGWLVLKL